MLAKKQNFLEKIVKRNYNNELEKLLEEKQFEENAKSTLLNILYKIETGYKDIEKVKKDIETKEEYIENLMGIIKNNCNSIKILKMSEQNNQIPENRTYIIDKENKEIIAYPIERKVLYAIAKIGKKEKIIKDNYFLIDQTISDLINTGNNIHMVEPLRDFNGYSWTTIPQEIESIDHNLIYQNLRILVGHKFLNKWIRSNEFMIDYFEEFKEELEKAEKELEHVQLVDEVSDVQCEKCGRMMVYKYGRYGKFLACPGFPECRNVKPIIETIDVPCPKCGGTVQVRKTKRRKNYYICENNPTSCDYISWNKPKKGEKWDPEEAKNIKSETKPKTRKRTVKKSKTTKRKK